LPSILPKKYDELKNKGNTLIVPGLIEKKIDKTFDFKDIALEGGKSVQKQVQNLLGFQDDRNRTY
jgi:hypothetical protein